MLLGFFLEREDAITGGGALVVIKGIDGTIPEANDVAWRKEEDSMTFRSLQAASEESGGGTEEVGGCWGSDFSESFFCFVLRF